MYKPSRYLSRGHRIAGISCAVAVAVGVWSVRFDTPTRPPLSRQELAALTTASIPAVTHEANDCLTANALAAEYVAADPFRRALLEAAMVERQPMTPLTNDTESWERLHTRLQTLVSEARGLLNTEPDSR